MADAINATSGVAQSYVADSRPPVATAQNQSVDARDGARSVQAAQSVDAARSADKVRTDNNRAPELSEQEQQKQLEAAVEKINEMMRDGQRSLSFSVDKDINQVVVTVTNTETDEIVRQIPNEEAIAFSRHMESMMGLIFNDKA